MLRRIGKLLGDRRGGTAIEYGFIVALVVIALIVALRGLANQTINMWNNVSDQVINA